MKLHDASFPGERCLVCGSRGDQMDGRWHTSTDAPPFSVCRHCLDQPRTVARAIETKYGLGVMVDCLRALFPTKQFETRLQEASNPAAP